MARSRSKTPEQRRGGRSPKRLPGDYDGDRCQKMNASNQDAGDMMGIISSPVLQLLFTVLLYVMSCYELSNISPQLSFLLLCCALVNIIQRGPGDPDAPGITLSVFRLLCCKGMRRAGKLTKVVFPIKVSDLTGPKGPQFMTSMLRDGGHLPSDAAVLSVRDIDAGIRDGVKGDKAIVEVVYSYGSEESEELNELQLPTEFFVKFNLQNLSQLPMRYS